MTLDSFIEVLSSGYPGEWWWEVRSISAEGAESRWLKKLGNLENKLGEWRGNLEAGRFNVYLGVNPRNYREGKADFVPCGTILYLEIDTPRAIYRLEELRAKLAEHKIKIAAVVVSSENEGKMHVYVKLKEPAFQTDWMMLENKLRDFTESALPWVQLDKGTKDICRILRIPGTLNFKYLPPQMCRLKEADADAVTDAAAVDALPVEAVHPEEMVAVPWDGAVRAIPDSVDLLIRNGAAEGDRHFSAWLICKELHKRGFPDKVVEDNVLRFNANCQPPKHESIIKGNVRYWLAHAGRYLSDNVDAAWLKRHDYGLKDTKLEKRASKARKLFPDEDVEKALAMVRGAIDG